MKNTDSTNILQVLFSDSQFSLAILCSIGFIVIVYFLYRFIRKWMVEEAILNIDKNLQKLIDKDSNNVSLPTNIKKGVDTVSKNDL